MDAYVSLKTQVNVKQLHLGSLRLISAASCQLVIVIWSDTRPAAVRLLWIWRVSGEIRRAVVPLSFQCMASKCTLHMKSISFRKFDKNVLKLLYVIVSTHARRVLFDGLTSLMKPKLIHFTAYFNLINFSQVNSDKYWNHLLLFPYLFLLSSTIFSAEYGCAVTTQY